MMEYTNERDFKYVMQDVSQVFMGGRMTYEDMMTWEDVPFKIKAIINKYFIGKDENTLAETIEKIEQEDFRYQILKQLKIKIKAGTYCTKKTRRGQEERKYVSKVYQLDEYMKMTREAEAPVAEEFIFPKLALMAFSL